MRNKSINPEWAYLKNIQIEENEMLLSGFTRFGSVVSTTSVDFGNSFDLEFMFKLENDPMDHAAIFDIDFNNDLDIFISFIYKDGLLHLMAGDEEIERIWSSRKNTVNTKWHKAKVNISLNKVMLYIDDMFIVQHEYVDNLSLARISFSNNSVKKMGFEEDDRISFRLSNVNLTTQYGTYPINLDNLPLYEGEK